MKDLVDQVREERGDYVCGEEVKGESGVVRDLEGRETPGRQWTGTRAVSHYYRRASKVTGGRDSDKSDGSDGAKTDNTASEVDKRVGEVNSSNGSNLAS